MSGNRQFTVTLLGDIMLGRLIDQLLPTHVHNPEEARIVASFRSKHSHLQDYTHVSPWGNTLELFQKSDLVLGNLETSMTAHDVKWSNKVFNYRTHPDNVRCLTEAGIDYVSLANNHTLDFCKEGLFETIDTLEKARIAFAGAGTTPKEARQPAELILQDQFKADNRQYEIEVHSFSDHPSDWQSIAEFNHITYTSSQNQIFESLLAPTKDATNPPLRIVSIHWGPNYAWHPSSPIRSTAHFLIDTCAVDVIWGHSSHHIQGVEIYKGKLIIYGCGDFVDDYAVNLDFRNDLSAAWNLVVEPRLDPDKHKLVVRRLEVFPNRIRQFQAGILDVEDVDHGWIVDKFRSLCQEMGTVVREELGDRGQIIVDLGEQQ